MKMRAHEIRGYLKKAFPAPECAVVFEVAQATGFNANRHLDAVVMDLWPSRGLSLHGVEIKVSLHDWRREKADPSKAEQIARFCDCFSIAAPLGVVPVTELPMAWGLLEFDERGKMTVTKKAEKTDAEPVGRPFLAAMMRAACRPIDPGTLDAAMEAERQRLEAAVAQRVETEVARRRERGNASAASWDKLTGALEIDPAGWVFDSEIIAAVRVVLKAGVARTYQGLADLHQSIRSMTARLETEAEALGLDLGEPAVEERLRRHVGRRSKAAPRLRGDEA